MKIIPVNITDKTVTTQNLTYPSMSMMYSRRYDDIFQKQNASLFDGHTFISLPSFVFYEKYFVRVGMLKLYYIESEICEYVQQYCSNHEISGKMIHCWQGRVSARDINDIVATSSWTFCFKNVE